MKFLAKLALVLGLASSALAQTTHVFPAEDTNNTFTGQNNFGQINTTVFSGTGTYSTPQLAVAAACAMSGNVNVEIPVGTGSGVNVSSLTGCTSVVVIDKRAGTPLYYAYINGGYVSQNPLSGPVMFYATDSSSLAAALSSASAYTTAHSAPSGVSIACGNYNLASQFSEPQIGGVGVSLYGNPTCTNIYLSANNSGTPWEAIIFQGATAGQDPYYNISGINFYCTAQSGTTINALFGLELRAMHGGHVNHVQVSNCGSQALGGEDIATGGGGTTDEVQIFMDDVTANYNEGLYTGPAGGSGPTPPNNSIDLRGSTGDSVLNNLIIRNPQVCGVAIEHKGTGERSTGGIVVSTAHVFGFASISNPTPYFPQYAYCDESDFGGDRWVSDEVDSVSVSGWYINTQEPGGVNGINNIQITAPSFYWYTPFNQYSGIPNLMTLSASAVGGVDVVQANCTNHPYSSGNGNYITNNSVIIPAFYGGTGCGLQDQNGQMNTLSPLNVEVNGQNNLGDHSSATNYWSYAGGRGSVGYGANSGALLVQAGTGKQVLFAYGGTFDSSPTKTGAIDPTSGFLFGGSNPQNLSGANYRIDFSGITSQWFASSLASASTIAPTFAVTEITGTATISTITPPAACTSSAQSCNLILHSVAGFNLTTGGNISVAVTAPAGTFVSLVYLPNLTQWSVLSSTAFQVNGTGVAQNGLVNFVNSSTNASGLSLTFTNPSVGQVKAEVAGTYTGTLVATQIPASLSSTTSVNGTPIPNNTTLASIPISNHDTNCFAINGVKCVKITGQNAALVTTTLITTGSSGAGQYCIDADIFITTVGTSGTVTLTLGSNNGAGGSSNFYGPSALSVATLGGQSQGRFCFHVGNSTNITYSTSFGTVVGSPVYAFDISVDWKE